MSLWRILQGTGVSDNEPSGAETVEKLTNRLESSVLLDDRKDAIRAIKSLSRKFKLEVGTQTMTLLCDVLEKDRGDAELSGYALEAIYNVVSDDVDGSDYEPQPELADQFAEIFVKTSSNVHLLLECVEEYDSRVRVPAIKTVTSLLESRTKETQEHILTFPQGCSRLMDLLLDKREYIRNLAILLLLTLTKANTNIQKIVVFDDAFPRLIDIIISEGCSDGGVVVEDCLRILLNLLRGNPSNQTLFRENSYIAYLPQFFLNDESVDGAPSGIVGQEGWSAQKVTNILRMIHVIRLLVSPSNSTQNTRLAQKNIHNCGLLKALSDILMASGVPAEVLTETINVVAECVRGYKDGQDFLSQVQAPSTPPRPAIVVLLMSMVNDKQPFSLRLAVLYAFQSYLYKNADGQASVVSTLLPSSADLGAVTAGQLLCAGLFSSDSQTAWLAAVSLFFAVHNNQTQKEQLLRVQLATGLGSPPVSLLQHCANLLSSQPKTKSKLGLIQLLAGWLHQAPLVTKTFLSNGANLSLIFSELQTSDQDEQDGIVRGLYAFLLGICIMGGHSDLIPVVEKRVGPEMFLECLGKVSKSEIYVKSLQSPQHPDKPVLDHEFSKLFKVVEPEIIKHFSSEDGRQVKVNQFSEHESVVTQYKDLIKEQDVKLRGVQAQFDKMQAELKLLRQEKLSLEETVKGLRDQNIVLNASKGVTAPVSPSASSSISSSLPSGLNEIGGVTDSSAEVTSLKSLLEAKEKEISNLKSEVRNVRSASTSPTRSVSPNHEQENPYFPDDYDQTKMENVTLKERVAELEEQVNEVENLLQIKNSLERRLEELSFIEKDRNSLREKCAALTKDLDEGRPADSLELQSKYDDLLQNHSTCDSLNVELDALKTDNKNLSDQLELNKQALSAAEQERDGIMLENEDLLILLAEQESKISVLQNQVRDLGGTVEDDDIEEADFEDN